jgi:type IV pilus assembly protein PilB
MADLDVAVNQFRRDDEEQFIKSQAEQSGLEYINLVGYPILGSTLILIPLEDCIRLGIIAYLKVAKRLRVAITQVTPEVTNYLQQFSDTQGLEIHISLCSQSSLNFAIQRYVIEEQKVAKDTKIAVTKEEQQNALNAIHSIDELNKSLAEANATQVLDILFAAGTGMDASDIHLEPQELAIRVRFRIDGVLQDIASLSPNAYKQVVSRVKFLAKMKLDVRNVNQDGRFTIDLANTTLDVRVATLPSTYGEVINMRLLRAHAEFIKLDELGCISHDQRGYRPTPWHDSRHRANRKRKNNDAVRHS